MTKADYWVHVLADGERSYYCALLFPVARLKELVRKYRSTARGMGDNNANICVLIPLRKIFTHAAKRAKQSARRRKSASRVLGVAKIKRKSTYKCLKCSNLIKLDVAKRPFSLGLGSRRNGQERVP